MRVVRTALGVPATRLIEPTCFLSPGGRHTCWWQRRRHHLTVTRWRHLFFFLERDETGLRSSGDTGLDRAYFFYSATGPHRRWQRLRRYHLTVTEWSHLFSTARAARTGPGVAAKRGLSMPTCFLSPTGPHTSWRRLRRYHQAVKESRSFIFYFEDSVDGPLSTGDTGLERAYVFSFTRRTTHLLAATPTLPSGGDGIASFVFLPRGRRGRAPEYRQHVS